MTTELHTCTCGATFTRTVYRGRKMKSLCGVCMRRKYEKTKRVPGKRSKPIITGQWQLEYDPCPDPLIIGMIFGVIDMRAMLQHGSFVKGTKLVNMRNGERMTV